jgi:dTDP-4-amino-4,6-dideoxygalactose transaminase
MPKLFKPYVSWRAIFNVVRTLLGTQLAEGKQVRLFEQEFENKFNVKHAVALNSGTTALELAYELAGIGKDDEVITPVLTCTATNIPLLRRGCKIVFADIDTDLNINIEDVQRKITRRTKAIVFVHFGGNNRGLRELLQICRERGIICIEDAAQAVGSSYWGKGDYACVSLQAIKTLTSGDGGFLLCKKVSDYEKARKLRWFGYDREKKQKMGDTDLVLVGYKYHMNDITASIGRGNLKSINKVINHRKKLAKIYNEVGLNCHAWLCINPNKFGNQHHYRNDKYTIFKKFKNHCPVMDKLENTWSLVPYHHGISIRQAKQICKNSI